MAKADKEITPNVGRINIARDIERRAKVLGLPRVHTISEKGHTPKVGLCPRCKKVYHTYPSLSWVDNKTYVCNECGTMEAMMNAITHCYTTSARINCPDVEKYAGRLLTMESRRDSGEQQ
jgi:hypothetical protein